MWSSLLPNKALSNKAGRKLQAPDLSCLILLCPGLGSIVEEELAFSLEESLLRTQSRGWPEAGPPHWVTDWVNKLLVHSMSTESFDCAWAKLAVTS